MEPKKKKPLSMTARLKKAKNRIKEMEEWLERVWEKNTSLRDEIQILNNYLTLKFFEISYGIEFDNRITKKEKEIIEACNLQHAILLLTRKAGYGHSVILTDARVLGA